MQFWLQDNYRNMNTRAEHTTCGVASQVKHHETHIIAHFCLSIFCFSLVGGAGYNCYLQIQLQMYGKLWAVWLAHNRWSWSDAKCSTTCAMYLSNIPHIIMQITTFENLQVITLRDRQTKMVFRHNDCWAWRILLSLFNVMESGLSISFIQGFCF